MNLRYWVLIASIIVALFTLSEAQRGGGRSGGGGGSSFGGSRGSGRGFFSSSRKYKGKKSDNNLQVYLYFAMFIIMIIYSFIQNYLKNVLPLFLRNRKKSIQRITDQYVRKNEENICTLNEQQKNRSIDWFMRCSWKIQYKNHNEDQGQFDFVMKDIIKKTDNIYQIEARGQMENICESTIKGILLFQNDYLTICFDKQYDNREVAGQTGKWDLLIYQGYQQGQIFQGRWYYEGFQGDSKYSGSMRMFHRERYNI